MKRNLFAALAASIALFAMPSFADQSGRLTVNVGADLGADLAGGRLESHSSASTNSANNAWGNGSSSSSAFQGATNTTRLSITRSGLSNQGASSLEITTFSSGETAGESLSKSRGEAFGSAGGVSNQNGAAWGKGGMIRGGAFSKVGTDFSVKGFDLPGRF